MPKKFPRHKIHYVIPDTQIVPGRSLEFIRWIGAHIAEVCPDVVIHLGDHWDMPSLSSYDKGKRSSENRRYYRDIEAGNAAMAMLAEYIPRKTQKVFCIGNHEQRIARYVNDHAELEGSLGLSNLLLRGWHVRPFLVPIVVDGIAYCHFFPRSSDGRVMQNKNGARNARIQAQREFRSCTAGHQQGFDYHEHYTDSRVIQSMIVGSAYPYKMGYLTDQGQNHFRGVVVKRVYAKGYYDFSRYSLGYLRNLYTLKNK